jgi:HlyD family secretion protein
MSFSTQKSESHKPFSEVPWQEPVQQGVSNSIILYDLSVSTQEEEVDLPEDRAFKGSLIYGGVATSVASEPNVSSHTQGVKSQKQETELSPSPASNWSTSVQALLDQPPSSLPQRLVAGGMIFCLAFGAWASFGKIDEVGQAQGRLVPKGETYKVDPLEIGKVANIPVKEGQSVKAGQVLVELDTELASTEVDRLQQILTAAQIELSQKQTLLEKAQLEAGTRSQIAQAEIRSSKAAITQVNAKIAATRELIEENQAVVTAAKERIERLQPLTETAQNLIEQRQADAKAQKERLDRLAPLLKDGAISKELVYQAQQNWRDRLSAITQTQLAEAANTKEQVFQAQQNLRDRQSAITQSEGELKQTLAEVAQLQAALTQKEAEARRIQLESQQQMQQVEMDITQLKAKMAETKNLLTTAKTKLKQRFLYAPIDGVVSSLNARNKGEVVQPGQTVAEIAPQNAPLVLSANLPNREAGFVKVGMPVQVKLDAYPYQDYGIVSGKVTSISPDAKPDEKLGSVYRVKVELDRNYVMVNNRRVQFKAGQTGNADIILRRRRIADILLDPIRQLQKGGLSL